MIKWQDTKYYDWATILKTSIFLIGVFLLFFFLFNRGHYALLLQQRGKNVITTALVTNRSSSTDFVQTKSQGNVYKTNGVTVYYTYTVKDVVYNQKQVLYYSLIDGPVLNLIYRSKLPFKVRVVYDYNNPYKSSLVFN
ncbi:hypothetical protein [Mucilaginibacter jinjuensis]|uniref:DUF3592 domain-containing protein n=1 Tax=Mucilaginibacter jinjuensis TaxID=1176721 RepID=A0ABY7TBY7_9SPHI|nr:hypothetical protein [Mucilaginibacter jinjuensis]WCT13723.1 hypothetical protein PQO05_07215 [Mucilaginibacter jinjuensis]